MTGTRKTRKRKLSSARRNADSRIGGPTQSAAAVKKSNTKGAESASAARPRAGAPLQIIVLGMHRSGTSALTGALARMGVYVGDEDELTGKNWENPYGFFERRDARKICDALLHGSGADWWKVSAFDADNADFDTLRTQRPAIRDLVAGLDQKAKVAWALKEPRLCLLMPIFRSVLVNAFAIVVTRHPMEVARSLRRRNGFPIQAGLALWEAYTTSAIDNACQLDHTVVSYDALIEKPEETLKGLCEQLRRRGLDGIDPKLGQGGIQPSLRRERLEDNGLVRLTTEQHKLWRQLQDGALPKKPVKLSHNAIEILREFEADQAGRERLLTANKNLERDLKKATARLEEHAGALTERESRFDSLQSQLNERESELAATGAERDRLKAQFEAAERRKEELEHDLDQTRAKLDEHSRVLSEHTSELQSVQSQLNERESELAATGAERDRLKAQFEAAERRKEELEHDLDNVKTTREFAESTLEDAKKEIARLRARRDQEQQRAREYEREVREKSRRISDLHRRLERQYRRLAEKTSAYRDTRLGNILWLLLQPRKALGKRGLLKRAEKVRHAFLFDAAWYLEHNPDVLDAGEDPAVHYVAAGGLEGRAPHPLFDPECYAANCQDEIPIHLSPLEHYLAQPPAERASPHRLFARNWYLENNPDVADAGIDPLEHFIVFGGKEGRNPHPEFDSSWYLSTNPDVAQATVNPLTHFLAYGAKEGRDPHPNSSSAALLGKHPDIETNLGLTEGPKAGIEQAARGAIEKAGQMQASNASEKARPEFEHAIVRAAPRFHRFSMEVEADPAHIAVHIIVYSSAPSQQLRVTLEALNGALEAEARFVHVVLDWPEQHQNVKLPGAGSARIHRNRARHGYYASVKAVMDKIGHAHYCVVREGAVVCPEVIDALAAACVAQAWFDVASPITNGVPGLAVGMAPLESVKTTSKRLAFINGDASGIEAPMVDLDVFFVTKNALKRVPFPGFEEDKTDQSLIRFVDALRRAGHKAGIVLGSYAVTFSARGHSQSQIIEHVFRYVEGDQQPRFVGEIQTFTEATSDLLASASDTNPVITARRTVCMLASSLLLRGGVIVLVNWANQLIMRGFDVRVYVQHLNPEHEGLHCLLFKPKAFTSVADVVAELPVGSAVVATFWPTAVLAEEIVNAVPKARGYYFIQDYEVDFYAADSDEADLREQARKSYQCELQKVVTSSWIEGKLVDQEGIQPGTMTRIPVGIDHMLFPPQKIDRVNRSSVVIAAMARPETPRRGFKLLVDSLREIVSAHRTVSVLLFGSDDLTAKDIPFPCQLLGVVAPHELHRIYGAADVFVDTSDFQGFGLAPLEAMACGCACVVSDSGGVTEYASDQENALVVAHSSEAVSSALAQLVQDADLRARLADAAVETARKFDCSRTADAWAALLTADTELNADDQPGNMAVVVPIFNQLHAARRCIESILAAGLGDHHLVLVDDHSDTHTAEALAQYAEHNQQITYLRNPENLGFVGAANRGMAWAGDRGMDAILLNSDTAVFSNWLERLQNAAYADKRTGIVSPLSIASSHLYLKLNPGDSFRDADRWLKKNVSPTYPTVITPEGWCFLIKRGVYQRLGGFDTVFGRGYCEESDYCMRAVAAGYRLAVCDNLMVFHQGKVTFGSERSQRYLENRKVFDRRWHAVYQRLYDQFLRLDPLHSLRQRYAADSAPGQAAFAECPDLLAIFDDPQIVDEIASFEASMRETSGRSAPKHPKIVFLLPTLQPYGGTLSVVMLVNALIMKGIDVQVVVLSGKGYQPGCLGLVTEPVFLTDMQAFLNHFPRADIVIGTLWTTMYYAARLAVQRPGLKIGYYVQDFEADFPDVRDRGLRDKVLETYKWNVTMFAKTDWICEKVREVGGEIAKVSPALDVDVFYPRDPGAEPGERLKRVIGMLRPQSEQRAPEVLLKTFALIKKALPDVEVYVFGCRDDELSSASSSIVDCNLGVVENTRLPQVYADCDVYLDASTFHGFGRVIAEAMACGLPAAITDSGGISEFVVPGENCLVSEPGDPKALAENAQRLLADDELSTDIAQRARQAIEDFHPDRSAEEIFRVLTR